MLPYSIETDAEYLGRQIINNISSAEYLIDNGVPTNKVDFLKKDREDFMLQMTEFLDR